MDDYCGGCGKDLAPDEAILIREDDTGVELTTCTTCLGQLEGVTIL